MARVVLTRSLMQSIRHKIQAKFDEPRAKLLADFLQANKEVFYNAVVPKDMQDKLAQIPIEFVQRNSSMRFVLQGEALEVSFGSERPLPANYHSYYSRTELPLTPEIQQLYEPVKAERARLAKERDELLEEIDKVMNQCVTLKQLLEIWPSALDLCPPGVVERHNKVVAPRNKEEVKIELSDQTKLALVKVRMT